VKNSILVGGKQVVLQKGEDNLAPHLDFQFGILIVLYFKNHNLEHHIPINMAKFCKIDVFKVGYNSLL